MCSSGQIPPCCICSLADFQDGECNRQCPDLRLSTNIHNIATLGDMKKNPTFSPNFEKTMLKSADELPFADEMQRDKSDDNTKAMIRDFAMTKLLRNRRD